MGLVIWYNLSFFHTSVIFIGMHWYRNHELFVTSADLHFESFYTKSNCIIVTQKTVNNRIRWYHRNNHVSNVNCPISSSSLTNQPLLNQPFVWVMGSESIGLDVFLRTFFFSIKESNAHRDLRLLKSVLFYKIQIQNHFCANTKQTIFTYSNAPIL